MTTENLSRSDFPTTLAPPTPAHVRALRQHLALTQVEFGALVRSSGRAAQEWEAGRREMPLGLWELALIKAGLIELGSNPGG